MVIQYKHTVMMSRQVYYKCVLEITLLVYSCGEKHIERTSKFGDGTAFSFPVLGQQTRATLDIMQRDKRERSDLTSSSATVI